MEALKIFDMGNIQIICDAFGYENKSEIRDFINSKELKRLLTLLPEPCFVVLGGDGTMLRAIQQCFEANIPFFGINFGTKGFLLNDKSCLDTVQTFIPLVYPLLEAVVSGENRECRHVAFNEVQIKAAFGGMADLSCRIGQLSAIRTKGDGLLVVTPAGSTGYNRSASGPILPHSSHHYIVTPLLPFEPRGLRPIVYNQSQEITIVNDTSRERKISVYADSIPVIEGVASKLKIKIHTHPQKVTLLVADNYETTWQSKIFAEQGMELLDK